jgi:hypothetical protein
MSNEAVRQAVEKTSKLFESEPSKAKVNTPPVTASLTTGLAFRLNGARGEVQTDMPPPMGGKASAETPGWHIRAGLASCIATMIATRAGQLGIKLDLLEVTILSEVDYRGVLGLDDSVVPAMTNLRELLARFRTMRPCSPGCISRSCWRAFGPRGHARLGAAQIGPWIARLSAKTSATALAAWRRSPQSAALHLC